MLQTILGSLGFTAGGAFLLWAFWWMMTRRTP